MFLWNDLVAGGKRLLRRKEMISLWIPGREKRQKEGNKKEQFTYLLSANEAFSKRRFFFMYFSVDKSIDIDWNAPLTCFMQRFSLPTLQYILELWFSHAKRSLSIWVTRQGRKESSSSFWFIIVEIANKILLMLIKFRLQLYNNQNESFDSQSGQDSMKIGSHTSTFANELNQLYFVKKSPNKKSFAVSLT